MSRSARPVARRGLVKRALIIVLAGVILLVGLLVGGVRLLDAFAPQYRNALADRIGQRVDADIQIDGIALGWGWHGPMLYLKRLRVTRHGADAPALVADRVGLEFSVTDLLNGKRLPDGVTLDAPRLRLSEGASGRWRLADWSRPDDPPLGWARLAALRERLSVLAINDGRIDLDSAQLPGGHTRLTDVTARLQAAGGDANHWAARVSAHGPVWWPQVQAEADIVGNMPEPEQARFQARIQGLRPLVMAAGRHALSPRLAERLSGGAADIRIRGLWQAQRLQQARAQISLTAIHDRRQADALLPALDAVLGAESDRDARHVQLTLRELSSPTIDLAPTQASARIDTRASHISASAHGLPSKLVARIARLGVPQLARATVDISIDNIRLEAGDGKPLQMTAGFHGLSITDSQLMAGPIAGHYIQQDGRHRLTFRQAGGELAAAHYLNGPLPISDLDGAVSWQQQADGLHIGIHRLRLASRKAVVTANGNVRLPDRGQSPEQSHSAAPSGKHTDHAPVVDLTADIHAPRVKRLLDLIPQAADLPNPKLRDWLAKAITVGTLDRGHLRIRGPLDRFPFVKPRKDEAFHLTISGHGVDVQYKPDWPPLRQARGTLTLDGARLDLALNSARILKFGLDTAQVHVDDVRDAVLQITGQANHAQATDLMAFLVESPLRDRFGKLVNALKLSGRDDLSLNLRVPLKPELGDVQVTGRIRAHDNRLVQDALPGPVTAINGHVGFDQQGLTARQLTGNLLGVPITADLSPAADGAQRIVAHARPRLPADRAALAHYLPLSWLAYGHGQSSLQVALSIARDGDVSPIRIDSQLTGMAITLPTPLSKTADASTPLSVTVDTDSQRVAVDYDHRLRVKARLDDGRPARVQALLNGDNLQPPDKDGLWIGGRADQVDAIGWFNVVQHVLNADATATANTVKADRKKKTESAKPPLAFLGGDLRIGRLSLDDRYYPNTHVRAEPMSNTTGWRVNLEGPATQGQITWTAKTDERMAIAGNLKRLALSTETPASRDKRAPDDDSSVLWPDLSPMDLPRLQLFVQQFVVDDTDFGEAHLDATPMADGWRVDRFALKDGALSGHASAHWQRANGMTRASANADFDGHGLSRLVRIAGYISPVESKQARLRARLAIAPNPAGLDLAHLGGEVHFTLDDGTLLSIEPGPGRLLGLFNLYVLPRRLRLDFRDVVDKGMAFDKAKADFNIQKGQAYSNNLQIKTPSSEIRIDGRIGIATRDYDEHVTISPKLGTGVAIASALVGGPIVGAAVFAVQELLKEPIQHFSSIGYTLKGSWDDPQIIDPKAQD